jgi:2'-hydroxyisoflavone reductase
MPSTPASISRRDLLALSAAGLAASALSARAIASLRADDAKATPAPPSKLRILILGGTGFLGPACSEAALRSGHHVTLFNRGKTETRRKSAGRPSAVPDGVEVLYGNRDPNRTSEDENPSPQNLNPPVSTSETAVKGLTQLEGKTWDAVIDTSAYYPRMAKASAELLAKSTQHYVLISTLSVYADNSIMNADESAALGTMTNPALEDMGMQMENYGPLKALCEQAVETAMPGRTTVLRPGFIVGPRDTTKRFMYWPVRTSQGGTMIVPGEETDPIQIIDVRDLADFIVRCIERKTVGIMNATGPRGGHDMKSFVQGIAEGCYVASAQSAAPQATFIDPEFLRGNEIEPIHAFPLWLPSAGETAGFHTRNVDRALAAGLTLRPLKDTGAATLEWLRSLPEATQAAITPTMMKPEQEAELITMWKNRK